MVALMQLTASILPDRADILLGHGRLGSAAAGCSQAGAASLEGPRCRSQPHPPDQQKSLATSSGPSTLSLCGSIIRGIHSGGELLHADNRGGTALLGPASPQVGCCVDVKSLVAFRQTLT